MLQSLKTTRQKLLLSLVLAGIFCLVFNLIGLLVLAVREYVFTRQLVVNAEVTTKTATSSTEYFSSIVFFDAILNVVQNYYVDGDRIKYHSLLKKLLEALSPNPEIQVTHNANNYFIEVNKHKLSIKNQRALTYEDLLLQMARLAQHLHLYLKPEPSVQIGLTKSAKLENANVIVMNALLSSLDAHSIVLSHEAYQDLRQGTEGAFGGLGVLVGIRDQLLTVIKPLPRSPALRAGIRRNDRIVNINGISTFGYHLDDLVEYMRGAPGTSVDLGVLHDSDASPRAFSLIREVIKVDSVTSKTLEFGGMQFLYLAIENFSSRTSLEVEDAIKNFRKSHAGRLPGLILDLRSNPGGLLDQAVQVSDLFLESGSIVVTKGRHNEVESASAGKQETNFPIALLINEESASASEIVAGALQDHGRAVVIGQPSFGKGSVQTIFELPEERALKLTVARYYTPYGRSIQNVGIVPDIWLQPIFKNKNNQNLMGNFRYRSENFLDNHLDSEIATISSGKKGSDALFFKGYFLKPGEMNANDDNEIFDPSADLNLAKDKELNFAAQLLRQVNLIYPNELPVGARRATHWLGLAAQTILAEMKIISGNAAKWLKDKFSVNWYETKGRELEQSAAPLRLQVYFDNSKRYIPGETINLYWSITNQKMLPVDNVSLFLTSTSANFDTNEKLVGRISEGGRVSGTITLKVPTQNSESYVHVLAGLAVGGQVRQVKKQPLIVRLRSLPDVKLRTLASLTDEKGGSVAGTLEPGEQAKIKVRLFNDSNFDLKGIKTHVFNLAGTQIKVNSPRKLTVEKVAAREWVDFYLDITAANNLASEKLEFGLQMDCSEVFSDWKKEIYINGLPNLQRQTTIGAAAH